MGIVYWFCDHNDKAVYINPSDDARYADNISIQYVMWLIGGVYGYSDTGEIWNIWGMRTICGKAIHDSGQFIKTRANGSV